MSGFIIDPKVVRDHLSKPYDLKEAWNRACLKGTAPKEGEHQYTDIELSQVSKELHSIYNELTKGCVPTTKGKKQFVLTAGAPGAGKSTLLESMIVKEKELQNMVFSDPDERALKLMSVYKEDITNFGGGLLGLTLAYSKWRWASNYISGAIMNRANKDNYNILHGTTATSPFVSLLYDNAHKENYEVTTLIVCAPDDVREQSAKRRFEVEQTRYTHDTKEKGKLFYERAPTIFSKTDSFKLYWRGTVQGEPLLAASADKGKVTVLDKNALNSIDEDLQNHTSTSWKSLQKKYKLKFKAQRCM